MFIVLMQYYYGGISDSVVQNKIVHHRTFFSTKKMGVKGCSLKFINTNALVYETFQGTFPDTEVVVDLCGTFYPQIQEWLLSGNIHYLLHQITSYFTPSEKITFVIDGNSKSLEKEETHFDRQSQRSKKIKQLGNAVKDALKRVEECRKVTKCKWKNMKKLIRSTVKLTADKKEELKNLLLNAKYAVVQAEGEADVWIASQREQALQVVSQDSDMLFHESVAVWYRTRRSRGQLVFDMIKKEDVMRRLDLSSSTYLSM